MSLGRRFTIKEKLKFDIRADARQGQIEPMKG